MSIRMIMVSAILALTGAGTLLAGEPAAKRCMAVEAVPGVKTRPLSCPPEQTELKTGPDAASAGKRPGFYSYGNMELRISGRVRAEGGYFQQPAP